MPLQEMAAIGFGENPEVQGIFALLHMVEIRGGKFFESDIYNDELIEERVGNILRPVGGGRTIAAGKKVHMEKYKILMETNRKMIFAEEISDIDKTQIVSTFLNGICSKGDIIRYKRRMRVDTETDSIYPYYYIPPYNGNKKLRLVQGYLPKTNILYANHYELEIIRLLSMFAPENRTVDEMADNTLHRLKNTCFGNSCIQGECLATGISVLRFLSVTRPYDLEWIDKLLTPLGDAFLSFGKGQASVHKGIPLWYLLMAFTDINNEKTRCLIAQRKEWLLGLLRKGWITGKLSNGKISEGDSYNLMGKYIIRNAIGTLPGYEDISEHKIYINKKDERCYCDI